MCQLKGRICLFLFSFIFSIYPVSKPSQGPVSHGRSVSGFNSFCQEVKERRPAFPLEYGPLKVLTSDRRPQATGNCNGLQIFSDVSGHLSEETTVCQNCDIQKVGLNLGFTCLNTKPQFLTCTTPSTYVQHLQISKYHLIKMEIALALGIECLYICFQLTIYKVFVYTLNHTK